VPMEDYEVRDVLRRQDSPLLRLRFHPPQLLPPSEAEPRWFGLPFAIENDSRALAEYAISRVYVDSRLAIRSSGGLEVAEGLVLAEGRAVTCLTHKLAVPGHLPVWQGLSMNLCPSPLEFSV